MADNLAYPYNRRRTLTIDGLPDDVLLAIFDFCVVRYQYLDFREVIDYEIKRRVESWQSLVHVCRRWRGLVFRSPRHLNLQICCRISRYATNSKSLAVWPALPLLIQGDVSKTSVDKAISVLKHSDRICHVDLNLYATSQIENLWTAMQVSFPELTALHLASKFGLSSDLAPGLVLPDSFLGGSAPRLRYLALTSISFPGLPKLLSSATHLVHLQVINLPHSAYFSPEAMVTCLSVLPNLEDLYFQFHSPQSSPDQESRRPPPPPTRPVLPALGRFWFKGANEYLEELVARINTPQLHQLSATFFNDIDFDTSELIRFVSRSSTFKAFNEAHVSFGNQAASVKLQPEMHSVEYFEVEISCREPGWQLSSLAQICTASLPLLSTTENLFIYEPVHSHLDWKASIENTDWLELLLPFMAVKGLYLSKQFVPRIAPTLQELTGGRTTEVLPTLQNLFLEGFQPSEPVHEGIGQFISARQLTNCPVAISAQRPNFPPYSLIRGHAAMSAKYLDDRFDIWPRTGPSGEQEWRVKCLDCPGKKLYIPGDGMSNFEVHLKNRNHRARVAERLGTTRIRSSHDYR